MIWGTVTRLRAAATANAHGSSVYNWAGAARVTVYDVKVQPVDSAEGDMKVSRARLLSKPGTTPDLTAFDRLISDGLTWQIVGDPGVFGDLLPHVEADLIRVTG